MIIISKILNEKRNAGPKAPSDICKILNNSKKKEFKESKYIIYKVFLYFIFLHFKKDIIIIQHPVIYNNKVYKLLNKKKTIILIHDISGLRNGNNEMLNKEIGLFKMFKYIIVHNEKMKQFLIDRGVPSKNLYVLEIFDYLTSKNNRLLTISKNKTIPEVVYAGNLKKEKTPFIYQLDFKKIKFKLNLYGLGLSESLDKNIKYMGSFDPDDLSSIKGQLGLVWDGNFDESDQELSFKNYTRYNNPHKLSCYLASNMPVIVWKQSAISDFVKKHNIGYVISNIYDINNLDISDYNEKARNAKKIGDKLKEGYYTKRIINIIVKDIGGKK